jgi:hypothetical protein
VEEELVLRYVIERKTSRDLASSIIDGRYGILVLTISIIWFMPATLENPKGLVP